MNEYKKIILTHTCSNFYASKLINFFWLRGACIVIAKPNMTVDDFVEFTKGDEQYGIIEEKEGQLYITDKTQRERLSIDFDVKPVKAYSWQENEPAVILYTSGSTGAAKGVCHSYQNILNSAKLFVDTFNIASNDKVLSLAPIYTMSGFRAMAIDLFNYAQVAHSDNGERLNWLNCFDSIKPSYVICGPQFIGSLIPLGRLFQDKFSNINFLCTGAYLDHNKRVLFEKTYNATVLIYYGLTETCGLVLSESINVARDAYLPSVCCSIKILLKDFDKKNNLYKLFIYTPNLYLGYFGEALSCKKDDYYDTGDIVYKVDNKLKLLGRENRAVKSANGVDWIYPEKVEQLLKAQGIDSAYVTSNKIRNLAPFTCYIPFSFSEKIPQIQQSIKTELGEHYEIFQFKLATVKLTSLGKIKTIEE